MDDAMAQTVYAEENQLDSRTEARSGLAGGARDSSWGTCGVGAHGGDARRTWER
jgi:hypothetical protein